MSYFKLDIPKLDDAISSYKFNKKNYLEDVNIVYSNLGYTESAWNDPNAYTFIERIKSDKYKLNNYFNYLDDLYEQIDKFKDNIDDICHKYGYRRNSVVLKFDDSEINECKKYLNTIIELLNSSLNQININLFGTDFEYISLVYELRSEIKSIRSIVNNIIDDIKDFTISVNNEINNSKTRLKRIDNDNFKLKNIDYKWNTTDLNIKSNKEISFIQYNNVNTNNISDTVKNINSNLSNNASSFIGQVNNIEKKEQRDITGLNGYLNTFNTNVANIRLEETKGIERLNTNPYNSNISNIVLERTKKVDGLNANTNAYNTNTYNIGLEKVKEVEGLNNNLNSIIDKDNQIIFDTDDVGKLNNNVNQINLNENKINYQSNSSVNLKTNIIESNTNQNNINISNIMSNNYDLKTGITTSEVNSNTISTNINNNTNLDININKIEYLNDLNNN